MTLKTAVQQTIRLTARDITYNVQFRNITRGIYARYHPPHIMLLPKQRGINSLVSCMNYYYFRLCVPCSYDATAEKSPLFSMNSIKVQRERKIGRRLFRISRKTSHHEILCLSRVATAKKSYRKACVIMHVQSNVLLVTTLAWMF